jgi:hypothetical protein
MAVDNTTRPTALLSCSAVVLAGALVVSGCGSADTTGSGVGTRTAAALPTDDQLRDRLDEVLDWTYDNRRLSLQKHAAWQILHGALAYQRQFMVERDGELVSAVDHLLEGGPMTGWTTQPGVWLDKEQTQRGLRAILEQGTKTGQGHADQWLAVLAQCELQPSQTIVVDGNTFTMSDFVAQVQFDVPRNVEREYSWTLIGLTTYLDTDASWTASDGKEWSVRRLVEIEAQQERDSSACGGTHRLIGMTMALRHHENQGREVEGPWAEARTLIKKSIEDAKRNRNPDGSFSTNYFARGGMTTDLASGLGSTGHVLEFLSLALEDRQLHEPWVKRSVVYLCDLFDKTKENPLECGALYHAAHGLILYRRRAFGPRESWGTNQDADDVPAVGDTSRHEP